MFTHERELSAWSTEQRKQNCHRSSRLGFLPLPLERKFIQTHGFQWKRYFWSWKHLSLTDQLIFLDWQWDAETFSCKWCLTPVLSTCPCSSPCLRTCSKLTSGIKSRSKKAPSITQRQTKTENLQRYRPRAASLSFREPEAREVGVETIFRIYLSGAKLPTTFLEMLFSNETNSPGVDTVTAFQSIRITYPYPGVDSWVDVHWDPVPAEAKTSEAADGGSSSPCRSTVVSRWSNTRDKRGSRFIYWP